MAVLDVPKRHKAVVYDQPGRVSTEFVDLYTQEPRPGEVPEKDVSADSSVK
jgi:propanol-preferring alcohol dehydrogenase